MLCFQYRSDALRVQEALAKPHPEAGLDHSLELFEPQVEHLAEMYITQHDQLNDCVAFSFCNLFATDVQQILRYAY